MRTLILLGPALACRTPPLLGRSERPFRGTRQLKHECCTPLPPDTERMPKAKKRDADVGGRLATALKEQSLIRVSRTLRRSDKIDGFVVGIGQAWVLIAELEHASDLNGFQALRLGDIAKVQQRGGPETFVGRALVARGQWPPVGADVDLDNAVDLIRSAAEAAPLVALFMEEEDPGVCFVGRPVRLTSRSVHLLEISAQAEWSDNPTKWRLADVTRVEFGSRYEEALTLVGGAPPS
jgi:hypothetical protein